MFDKVPKLKGLTNPLKNGKKTKRILEQHNDLLAKTGAKPPRSPLK